MDQKEKLIDDVKNGRLGEVVKAIEDGGADINTADENGRTLLVWAAFHNHVEVFKWLCANGANLNSIQQKWLECSPLRILQRSSSRNGQVSV